MPHHVLDMARVRVLLLTNAITPDRAGGLQRYVRDLGSALSRQGADVMIQARKISPDDPERSTDPDGVELWRFPTPSRDHPLYAASYPAASARAVWAAVGEAREARVLHSHFPLQGLPLAVAGVPYVHTFHAPVYRELIPERQNAYALHGAFRGAAVSAMRVSERSVLRHAGSVVVLSEFMREEAALLGAPVQETLLLPGGIDTERFTIGAPIDHPLAEGEGPLLFTARRMVPRTGVRELVEAFATIAREIPGARLALAGTGPLEDQIRTRTQELELGDRVAFLGWISDEELVGWYRAADLVIMPSQELEGFGLTSAEALACGTPVVGTPVGANPEVLRRLDSSLITRDASPDAIAEAVVTLVRQPERLRTLAERARAAVHPVFDWASIADSYLALYERYQSPSNGSSPASTASAPPRDRAPDLIEILRSPISGARLFGGDDSLHTADGGESFPVIDGIPILFARDSAFSADAYSSRRVPANGVKRHLLRRLRRAAPSLSHNLSAARNFERLGELLRARSADGVSRVLVVGGATLGEGMEALLGDPAIDLLEADVAIGPRTDVICDAHTLPFDDDVFDGVVCQAVLEHVADPPRVVSEIHRVLKPGGLVYSEIPFMQQVHEGAHDFTRYTLNGQRRLFRWFEEIDAGATAGPGMALGWAIRSLMWALVGERPRARTVVNVLVSFTLFWLKYLDRAMIDGAAILDGASGIYFLGRAQESPRDDREILDGFRGVNSGFSLDR